MKVIRKRLTPVAEEMLTDQQKKAALELRFAITRKGLLQSRQHKESLRAHLKQG